MKTNSFENCLTKNYDQKSHWLAWHCMCIHEPHCQLIASRPNQTESLKTRLDNLVKRFAKNSRINVEKQLCPRTLYSEASVSSSNFRDHRTLDETKRGWRERARAAAATKRFPITGRVAFFHPRKFATRPALRSLSIVSLADLRLCSDARNAGNIVEPV